MKIFVLALCLRLDIINSLIDYKDSSHERFFYSDISEISDISSEFELSDMSDFESYSDVDFVSITDNEQSTEMYANFPTPSPIGNKFDFFNVSISADHTGTFTGLRSKFLPTETNNFKSASMPVSTKPFDTRSRQHNIINILAKPTIEIRNRTRNGITPGVASFIGDISNFPGIQNKDKQQFMPSERRMNNDTLSVAPFPGILTTNKLINMLTQHTTGSHKDSPPGVVSLNSEMGNFPGISSTDKLKHLTVPRINGQNSKNNNNVASIQRNTGKLNKVPDILTAEKLTIIPVALKKWKNKNKVSKIGTFREIENFPGIISTGETKTTPVPETTKSSIVGLTGKISKSPGILRADKLKMSKSPGILKADKLKMSKFPGILKADKLKMSKFPGILKADKLKMSKFPGILKADKLKISKSPGILKAVKLKNDSVAMIKGLKNKLKNIFASKNFKQNKTKVSVISKANMRERKHETFPGLQTGDLKTVSIEPTVGRNNFKMSVIADLNGKIAEHPGILRTDQLKNISVPQIIAQNKKKVSSISVAKIRGLQHTKISESIPTSNLRTASQLRHGELAKNLGSLQIDKLINISVPHIIEENKNEVSAVASLKNEIRNFPGILTRGELKNMIDAHTNGQMNDKRQAIMKLKQERGRLPGVVSMHKSKNVHNKNQTIWRDTISRIGKLSVKIAKSPGILRTEQLKNISVAQLIDRSKTKASDKVVSNIEIKNVSGIIKTSGLNNIPVVQNIVRNKSKMSVLKNFLGTTRYPEIMTSSQINIRNNNGMFKSDLVSSTTDKPNHLLSKHPIKIQKDKVPGTTSLLRDAMRDFPGILTSNILTESKGLTPSFPNDIAGTESSTILTESNTPSIIIKNIHSEAKHRQTTANVRVDNNKINRTTFENSFTTRLSTTTEIPKITKSNWAYPTHRDIKIRNLAYLIITRQKVKYDIKPAKIISTSLSNLIKNRARQILTKTIPVQSMNNAVSLGRQGNTGTFSFQRSTKSQGPKQWSSLMTRTFNVTRSDINNPVSRNLTSETFTHTNYSIFNNIQHSNIQFSHPSRAANQPVIIPNNMPTLKFSGQNIVIGPTSGPAVSPNLQSTSINTTQNNIDLKRGRTMIERLLLKIFKGRNATNAVRRKIRQRLENAAMLSLIHQLDRKNKSRHLSWEQNKSNSLADAVSSLKTNVRQIVSGIQQPLTHINTGQLTKQISRNTLFRNSLSRKISQNKFNRERIKNIIADRFAQKSLSLANRISRLG